MHEIGCLHSWLLCWLRVSCDWVGSGSYLAGPYPITQSYIRKGGLAAKQHGSRSQDAVDDNVEDSSCRRSRLDGHLHGLVSQSHRPFQAYEYLYGQPAFARFQAAYSVLGMRRPSPRRRPASRLDRFRTMRQRMKSFAPRHVHPRTLHEGGARATGHRQSGHGWHLGHRLLVGSQCCPRRRRPLAPWANKGWDVSPPRR